MKEIQLTQGRVALVDDEDFESLNRWKWHAAKSNDKFYARRTKRNNKNCFFILMHRSILNINDRKILVDHKDHDGLNNQRHNIRPCTISQNQYNRVSNRGSTSKFKGVFFETNRNKWRCQIYQKGRLIFIGRFEKEVDAAIAYNNAAKIIHGEFANLNKVNEVI